MNPESRSRLYAHKESSRHPKGMAKTSERAIRQLMRERQVLEYRLQHLPYHEISRKMQMPLSTVKDHARRGMDALLPVEFADEIRKRDMADLDELSRKFKPLALEGDHVACKRLIEIVELRERLAGNITRSHNFNGNVIFEPPPTIRVGFSSNRPAGADDPVPDMNGPRPISNADRKHDPINPSFKTIDHEPANVRQPERPKQQYWVTPLRGTPYLVEE